MCMGVEKTQVFCVFQTPNLWLNIQIKFMEILLLSEHDLKHLSKVSKC